MKKEEEKRKKDEEREQERIRREEEKRRKEEEREQEKLKREEEKRKKDEEKKQKDEEKEQQRLKREEEKQKKELERKQKQEEKDREKLKMDEAAKQQADFLKCFLSKTPIRKSGGSANSSLREHNGSILDSSNADSPPPKQQKLSSGASNDVEVIDISETENINENLNSRSPTKIPQSEFHPMPFQVKNGMALAPLLRRASLNIFEKHSVDKMVHPIKNNQSPSLSQAKPETPECQTEEPMEVDPPAQSEVIVNLATVAKVSPPVFQPYLESLKKGLGRKSSRTEVKHFHEDADEIEIIDPKVILMSNPTEFAQVRKLRYKLLQFHLNHRPAYWGTWRRRPLKVNGRRPFAREEVRDLAIELIKIPLIYVTFFLSQSQDFIVDNFLYFKYSRKLNMNLNLMTNGRVSPKMEKT